MTLPRKFKVTTTVTRYMWAASREDAAKFQEELIRRGRLSLGQDGRTEARFCFSGGENFLEAPEDISKTRDPVEEPRRLDWLEIAQGDVSTCALVTRLSRRKVYYYEALSRTERSVDRDKWKSWARLHAVHPRYDGTLPPFIIGEAIEAHERRGLLRGVGATPDSSLILDVLDDYGYVPDDYEVENGYWAELLVDRALSEHILRTQSERVAAKTGTHGGFDEEGDFSVGFSEDLPTLDDLNEAL
jgi:hypothetical protein